MRLINADELYKLIEDYFDGVCVYDAEPSEAVNDFQHIVDLAPTVDAEPIRHGRWREHKWAEEVEGLLVSNYECSNCHCFVKFTSNYCPDCGAKMDEVKE